MAKKRETTTDPATDVTIVSGRVRMTDDQFAERMRSQGKDENAIASAIELRNEPHDAKFRRLINPRVLKAKKAILSIRALSNKSAYTFTESQVQEVLKRLNDAVATVKAAFGGQADNGYDPPI